MQAETGVVFWRPVIIFVLQLVRFRAVIHAPIFRISEPLFHEHSLSLCVSTTLVVWLLLNALFLFIITHTSFPFCFSYFRSSSKHSLCLITFVFESAVSDSVYGSLLNCVLCLSLINSHPTAWFSCRCIATDLLVLRPWRTQSIESLSS